MMKALLILSLTLSNSAFATLYYSFPNPLEECRDPFPSVEALFLSDKSKKPIEEIILEKSKTLEERLGKVIFGQESAVRETSNAIIRYAAGINDPNGVIASLLYCGPSGVGKTELAKQLALELYGDLSHFVRINMSEYIEPHHINRLIGSPPGYVGYEEGGQLTNAILRNPNAVVLLDEVEKAHSKVLKLFLHIFDSGVFTSSKGQVIDCRKCIFISTSNLACQEIAQFKYEGLNDDEIMEEIKPLFMNTFSPELCGRWDFLIFGPLGSAIVEKLVLKMLGELKDRVERAKQIQLIYDPTLIAYIKARGIDPSLGARPLKRLIEKELATLIAKAIIHGNFKKKDKMMCSYHDGLIAVEKL